MQSQSLKLPSRISVTQIGTWQRCHFKFFLKYLIGLSAPNNAEGLVRGSMLHNAYDAYLMSNRLAHAIAYDSVLKDHERMVNDGSDPFLVQKTADQARTVLEFYLPWADKNDNFTLVLAEGQETAEHSETAPLTLPNGQVKQLFYKIDSIIDRGGQLLMLENKFRKKYEQTPNLVNDRQSLLYLAAWNSTHPDRPLEGIYYNVVGVRDTYQPTMRKDGKGYLKGCSPEEIQRDTINRQFMYHGAHEQAFALQDAANIAYEMERTLADPHPVFPLTLQEDCKWCEFYAPCLAMRSGATIQEFVDSGQYSTRESRTLAESKDVNVATTSSILERMEVLEL